MQTTCNISVCQSKYGFFINNIVHLPFGKFKYFTTMVTKTEAEQFAKEYNITIEVIS